MFLQIITMVTQGCQAVYDWFWDFLHDGYGNIALTIVFGMVIFSIVYRFLILPLMGNSTGISSSVSSIHSDYVKKHEYDHPDFSERR